MIALIIAFTLKILDISLSTAKTIFINKEKYMIGALLNALSTFFYLVAIVRLSKDNSMSVLLMMTFATFLGTYLPGIMIKKSERDKLYIFDITADSLENGIKFADTVRNKNIAIKTYTTYNSKIKKTLSCKVYCITREESKFINNNIPSTFKYDIYIPVYSE